MGSEPPATTSSCLALQKINLAPVCCPAQNLFPLTHHYAGSSDAKPTNRDDPCEYNSCPARSGPVGHNATRPDLNWVNSFPVTAIKYGIDTFGPQLWGGAGPDLAVTGPNVGSNLFLSVPFSGTVGAAAYAVHTAKIPAIAFSGADDTRFRWDTSPVPRSSAVYGELATNLTNAVIASGKPYLPDGVFLNVNFPHVTDACPDAGSFHWVLSRINPGVFSSKDVNWCGSTRLPTEHHVEDQSGCYISISIGDASDKTTMNDVAKQQVVLDKLKSLLTCLP